MNIAITEKSSFNTVIKFNTESEAESKLDFDGKAGTIQTRYGHGDRYVLIGTGSGDISSDELRDAVATAIRSLCKNKVTEVSIELSESSSTASVVEGAILGDYSFDKYLTEKSVHIESLELINADENLVERARVTAESACLSRDLINENADIITPEKLAEVATEIAKSSDKISLEILTEKEIKKLGLGMLWAVGQGSDTPPRLILMNYKGNASSDERTALVGKGVTFDAGGLNMKPSGFIETMRSDMSGAAATLGVMKTLAELEPEINVIGVVTSASNAVSDRAFFPGDVLTSYSGKTVEVLNTDAEGRLILGDAISYVKKNYEPTSIVNIATLTGAVIIALGDTMAGLFSNNEELKTKLYEAGERTGERLWELPIRKEHRKVLKSPIADLQNISSKARNASSITAAAFLESFVGETPWCHVDIAGTAWNKGEANGTRPKYGVGYGVRLLTSLLID